MKIKITADSTCDLSKELVEKYDIGIIPLVVIKENEEFLDGVTITPKEIFAHVAGGGNLCSTAARGTAVFEEAFREYLKEYDAVVHINISSDFSSSYQNACIAAATLPQVRVIDSRNLSTGQGLVVLKAWELAQKESDLDALKAQLDVYTQKVEASFVIDRLEYMVKGGRCSGAAALGANLLNLKPCIAVKDGKMSVVKKYRGHFEKSIIAYVKDRLADREDIDRTTIFITHTTVPDGVVASVKEAIQQYGTFENIYETDAGCTVSCHCGPGTLGILFVRK